MCGAILNRYLILFYLVGSMVALTTVNLPCQWPMIAVLRTEYVPNFLSWALPSAAHAGHVPTTHTMLTVLRRSDSGRH